MLSLDTTIDLDFRQFWRWWSRELIGMMPEKVRHFINEKPGRLIVRFFENEFEVQFQSDRDAQYVGRFASSEEGVQRFRQHLEGDERLMQADIVIRLAEQDALTRKLVFPIIAAENIDQVIAYELDRYTPFNADQAYFAVKILDRNKLSGQVVVMLAVTPKERLDALIGPFRNGGIPMAAADVEHVDSEADGYEPAYNLLPLSCRKKAPVLPRVVNGVLIALFCALLIASMVVPVWRQGRAVEKLQNLVVDMEREARNVENLQKEADRLIAQTQLLIQKKQDQPPILEMLNELSRLIADDTSLTYLQYANGRLQFQGQSPAASTLIGILENSPLFTNARFVSPVTQDPRNGFERFQITADVTRRLQQ
ncbi:MAG: PilN domain-containing protein [Methylomicrobium sp.]